MFHYSHKHHPLHWVSSSGKDKKQLSHLMRKGTLASCSLRSFKRHAQPLNGQRQANLVLIAYASIEGSGEPAHPLLAHTSSESRGTFRQKARSLAPLNCWACACTVKIFHDRMLEDTNSLDAAQISVRDVALCLKLPLVPSIL